MKLLRGKACQSALQRGNGKRLTVMGEVLMDGFSDRGSIPLISTNLIPGRTPGAGFDAGLISSTNLIAGRTPEVTIVVLPYGFVLATQIKDRL